MNTLNLVLAASTMLSMALIFSYVLGWANKSFYVEVDPKIEEINKALPGANCGGCGFVGCSDYAEAIVLKGVDINLCNPGGNSCSKKIASIMGIEFTEASRKYPIIRCQRNIDELPQDIEYQGDMTCLSASFLSGLLNCKYGCLGFGDCKFACEFDAIKINENKLPIIDYNKCTSCMSCLKACPQSIIKTTSNYNDNLLFIACSNKEKAKNVKEVCSVGCISCGICIKKSKSFIMQDDNIPIIEIDNLNDEEFEIAQEKCPNDVISKLKI